MFTMTNKRASFLLYIILYLATAILIAGSLILSPSFVEANFSPDNHLQAKTIELIDLLQQVLRFAAVLTLIGGIVVSAYAHHMKTREVLQRTFVFASRFIFRYMRRIAVPGGTRYVIVALLIAFFVVVFPVKREAPTDTALYSGIALDMYRGYDHYATHDSSSPLLRPLVPLMLNFSYSLFGMSPLNMFILVLVFFLASLAVLVRFSINTGHIEAGLIACCLIGTSYTIYDIVFYHAFIDVILSSLLIFAAFSMFKAFRQKSTIWFASTGILLAFSFLAKEMAIIFFPLPLLLVIFIPQYRQKAYLKGIGVTATALILTLVPWMIHTYTLSNGSYLLGTVFSRESGEVTATLMPADADNIFPWVKDAIYRYVSSIYHFFSARIVSHFSLAYVFLIAWGFTICRAFRRHDVDVFLTGSLVLFSPIMVFLAHNFWGMRVGMFLWMLSYLATARLLIIGIPSLVRLLPDTGRLEALKSKHATRIMVGVIAGILVTIQLMQPQTLVNVRDGLVMTAFSGEVEMRMTGSFNRTNRAKARLIEKHIPAGSNVLIDMYRSNALDLYTEAKYDFHLIRAVRSDGIRRGSDIKHPDNPQNFGRDFSWPGNERNYDPRIVPGRPLFIWTGQFPQDDPIPPITAIREIDLLDQIRTYNTGYIVTNKRFFFVGRYLENNSHIELVDTGGFDKFGIYEVKQVERSSGFSTRVSSYVSKYLRSVQRADPNRFKELKRVFLEYVLNLSPQEVSQLTLPRGCSQLGPRMICWQK